MLSAVRCNLRCEGAEPGSWFRYDGESENECIRKSEGENVMADLVFVAATLIFVVVAVLYVYACERLRLK